MTNITLEHTYRDASAFLAGIDPDWARLVESVGPCRLQPKPAREPYETLVRTVAYQQISTKAGDTVLGRFLALYADGMPSPEQLLATDTDKLRSCGYSMRKVETIQGIARGVIDGVVPGLVEISQMQDAEVIERLVSLKGIGLWTVEMMLIFTLSRMDILPADDLGVRNGYRNLKSLDIAPGVKALTAIGAAWSPYRTVASWYLWRAAEMKRQA
jgi:DNA-3-methyladenine glycosylase II